MANWVEHLDTSIRLWAAGLGAPMEALLRMALAALCGGLVGLEREMRGRQAGFRTNLLVCMGSALVMIVSMNFALTDQWKVHEGFIVRIDPARIAYGVMGGIGFLGAGTIMQSRGNIRGLTTAAALWCVAAIGLATGFGLYLTALMAAVLVLAALWMLGFAERVVPRREYRILTLKKPWNSNCAYDTRAQLQEMGWRVGNLSFVRIGDLSTVEVTVRVYASRRAFLPGLLRKIEDHPILILLSVQDG